MALSDQTRFSGDAEMEQRSVAQVREPSARYLVHAEFKQSGVGLIPNDWSLIGLGEIAELDVGLSKPKIIFGKGCPVVTVQDLYAGSIIDVAVLKRVCVTTDEIKKYRLTRDDILIGNASVKRDGIGYANRFDGASEDVIFAKYAYRARTLDSLLPLYLHHVLRAAFCRQWMVANSQTGTLTNLNKSAAKAIPITVPPTIEEQRAIATALSDVDALIAGLERLIAKKRDIKQASMQQLLTGQTRLPGFSGDWTAAPIGEQIDLLTGFPFASDQYTSSGVRLLRGSNVKRGKTDWSDDLVQHWPKLTPEIAKYELQVGDLVIAMDGSLVGRSYARLEESDMPALLLQRVARIRSKTLDIGFLCQLIGSDQFIKYCDSVKTVTAIPHISSSDINGYSIRIPPSLDEQTAIATVLADMDADLTALESRLAKTRAIKQGMMQELLTGRTRLV